MPLNWQDQCDIACCNSLVNPVRHGGAAVNKPVDSAPINLCTSEVCTTRISSALLKKLTFNRINHPKVMAVGQLEAAAAKDDAAVAIFEHIVASKGPKEAKILAHATKTGRWLNALSTSLSGCCLNKQE